MSPGEATTVLRSLPDNARKRVPLRARSGRNLMIGLLVLTVGAAAVLGYLSTRAERGTGKRENVAGPAAPGLETVPLKQRSGSDFDPIGGDGEHSDQTSALVDGDPATTWSTENYDGANLNNKPGVGVIIDAAPGVAAKRLTIRTPTPDFEASVWVADEGLPKTAPPEGWTRVSAETVVVGEREPIDLDTAGNTYRRYLVWITKLPPEKRSAKISEILLFK